MEENNHKPSGAEKIIHLGILLSIGREITLIELKKSSKFNGLNQLNINNDLGRKLM